MSKDQTCYCLNDCPTAVEEFYIAVDKAREELHNVEKALKRLYNLIDDKDAFDALKLSIGESRAHLTYARIGLRYTGAEAREDEAMEEEEEDEE